MTVLAFLLSFEFFGLFGPLLALNLIFPPSDFVSSFKLNFYFWGCCFSEPTCIKRPLSPTGWDILRFLRPAASLLFYLFPRLENGLSYISVFARLTNLSSKILDTSFLSLIYTPEILLCYNFMLISVLSSTVLLSVSNSAEFIWICSFRSTSSFMFSFAGLDLWLSSRHWNEDPVLISLTIHYSWLCLLPKPGAIESGTALLFSSCLFLSFLFCTESYACFIAENLCF